MITTKEAALVAAQGNWDEEDEENCSGLIAAQKAMDAFEPEWEDAPEPEGDEAAAEPVLVNAEEKAELEAKLAEEQAKVDTASTALAEANAALDAAKEAAASAKSQVASERAALLADAEKLQKADYKATTAHLAGLEMYYMAMHDNFYLLDGTKSKWWLYDKAQEIAKENVKRRQLYLVDTGNGSPAPLYDLGVTPFEIASCVRSSGLHCPVALVKNKLLIDCTLRLDMAASYKGVAYGFSSAGALNRFIEDPSPYLSSLPELMPRKLRGFDILQVHTRHCVLGIFVAVGPGLARLLHIVSFSNHLPLALTMHCFRLQVRSGMGEPVALEGCCPVSLTTGTPTNQTIVQGNDLNMVEYDGQVCTTTS